jgi:hypothetical protein
MCLPLLQLLEEDKLRGLDYDGPGFCIVGPYAVACNGSGELGAAGSHKRAGSAHVCALLQHVCMYHLFSCADLFAG